jgi:restriction endonuclease S subunit
MPKINQVSLSKIMVPVPPLAEQRRIVAKVDELMAICDRLEAQLTTGQTEANRLLEAVLYRALNDTSGAAPQSRNVKQNMIKALESAFLPS